MLNTIFSEDLERGGIVHLKACCYQRRPEIAKMSLIPAQSNSKLSKIKSVLVNYQVQMN
jgi:hypothetical protein